MMWRINQSEDLAFAIIPRAGNYAQHLWLNHQSGRPKRTFVLGTPAQAMVVSRRVAVVRDPIERVKSAYSLCVDNDNWPNPTNAPKTWQAFVDHVLDDQIEDDEHWLPQVDHIGGVATQHIKLETIDSVSGLFWPGAVPVANFSIGRPPDISDYRLSDLQTKYAADIAIWSSL